jgi:integrase
MKLTQKAIAALTLPAGKSELIVFDDSIAGFGYRVRSSGNRTWIYQYKFGTRSRRMTIGAASAITAAQARDAASTFYAKVHLGGDPATERDEGHVRAAETMAVAMEAYLACRRGDLRPNSFAEIERHLRKNCKPLHGVPLTRIDRRMVAARIATIVPRGKVIANRTRTSLSAFFAWCIREGLVDTNPVVGTNTQPERSRERVLSDAELKIIWNALGADDYSTVVRLLMLTGQRANEMGALSWSEIQGDAIELPGERTKNGRKHSVPIVPAVRAILENCQRRSDAFVFGRKSGRPFGGWGVCKRALDERIRSNGTVGHWTHHDLRRTMATWMAETGTAPHIIEAILNHVSGHKAGIAGVYNRSTYPVEKRIALTRWTDHLMAIVSGKQSAKVVALHA